MPPISRTTQSGPMTRNQLMGLNQYIASPGFPTLGRWDRARSRDLYVVKGSVARDLPVELTIVCDLSSDDHMVQPHGSYNSTYMQSPDLVGKKAKLQVIGQRPSADLDFGADYSVSHGRLLGLQGEVAATEFRNHFVTRDQLVFNYNLFEPKKETSTVVKVEAPVPDITNESDEDCSDQEDESDTAKSDYSIQRHKVAKAAAAAKAAATSSSNDTKPHEKSVHPLPYKVAAPYREIWAETEAYFDNRFMPVYGMDGKQVPYTIFPKLLRPGATVVITFTLTHFSIRADSRIGRKASDTFTANIVKIDILDLHDSAPSKSLSTPQRKSRYVSQTPPSRSTLKIAADAFSPIRNQTSDVGHSTGKSSKGKQRATSVTASDSASIAPAEDEPDPVAVASPERRPQDAIASTDLAKFLSSGIGTPSLGNTVDEKLMQFLLPFIAEFYRNVNPSAGPSLGPSDTPSGLRPQEEELSSVDTTHRPLENPPPVASGVANIGHLSSSNTEQEGPNPATAEGTAADVRPVPQPVGETREGTGAFPIVEEHEADADQVPSQVAGKADRKETRKRR